MDLSNREIAIVSWAAIGLMMLLLWPIFFRKKIITFELLVSLLRSFFAPKLSLFYIAMIAYIYFSVELLIHWNLWNAGQMKNTVVWSVSFALMAFFQIESIKKDFSFFKHVVLDNIKLIAIIEFIIGVYSFPLIVELILVPIMILLSMMAAYAEFDDKHAHAKALLNNIMVAGGLVIIGYAVYQLFHKPEEFLREQTFYDFVVPILLTILYLPFIFLTMLLTVYETIALRLHFTIHDKKLRWLALLLGAFIFNIRIHLLERWVSMLQRSEITSFTHLWNAVKELNFMRRMERNPPQVSSGQGWPAYAAKDLLKNVGLITGYYHPGYDGWLAISNSVDMDKGIIPNEWFYSVQGDVGVATQLVLKLYINNPEEAPAAHERFFQSARVLYQFAMDGDMPIGIANALIEGREWKAERNNIEILIQRFPHTNQRGYDIRFSLKKINVDVREAQ